MVLSTFVAVAIMAQPGAKARRIAIGTQPETILALYQRRRILLNTFERSSPDDVAPTSLAVDRVGLMSWAVEDEEIDGRPHKRFSGDCKWRYKKNRPNTAITDFFQASAEYYAWVDLDGTLKRTESDFRIEGSKAGEERSTSVVAIYRKNDIDVTVTREGVTTRTILTPRLGMEPFQRLFEPTIKDGMVAQPERQLAIMHPVTGTPYEFRIHARGRWQGHFFFLPQEGYYMDVKGSEGTSTMFVTRQGQLIRVDLPLNHDLYLESGPLEPERRDWGTFEIEDWKRKVFETHPGRVRYTSLITPVVLAGSRLVMPVPCVLAL